MYRKQMTPGMAACKKKYSGKGGKKKDSPYNYSLEMGAGQAVEKPVDQGNYQTISYGLTEAGRHLKEKGA
tara:strand:+ start:170 stop:379 length:210 start_codon:yes stop_codon:yes gene_type:complete